MEKEEFNTKQDSFKLNTTNTTSNGSNVSNIIKRKFIPKETHELIRGIDNENNEIINQYTLLSEIGEGSFSKVKLCVDVKTQKYYAAKVIKKKELASKRKGFKRDNEGKLIVNNYLKDALREIAILKKIECPNIIQLREIIHDNENESIWLIMDFAENGTILDFDDETQTFSINKQFLLMDYEREEYYTEEEIRDFLRGIINGIDYCKINLFTLFLNST